LVDHSTHVPDADLPCGEWTDPNAREFLRRMFEAAISSADPAQVLASHLPQPPAGRCVVVGAGKAAASMAAAVEAAWPDVPLSGVVVVPRGYGGACRRVRVREAGHPVPDADSVSAARDIMEAVRGLGTDDLVLALISGGGSAAMCLPLAGLTLEDQQITNRLLLASGLDIRTMNAVRRRISAIKGGKLAEAASPARVVTLAISDVPGDDPAAIASGPTVRDPTADMDLRGIAARLGPRLPAKVAEVLSRPGRAPVVPETSEFSLIATPARALEAAAGVARSHEVVPVTLGDAVEGESRRVGQAMAELVQSCEAPAVLLSGGETTVTLDGRKAGRGGRNTEFLLSLACALEGRAGVWALAADTDGEDGANLGAAGALAAPDTLGRAAAAGLAPRAYLDDHDSGSFFDALGDLVITGPTRTNVNDFRAILVVPRLEQN
jgi:hydroxypyruvate reductase